MLKVLLSALVIVAGLYLLVAKTNIEAIGFREIREGEPDTVLGVVVIVLALALAAVLLFVPSPEGTSHSSKVYLWGYASIGVVWGVAQLRRRKSKRQR